MKETSGAGEGLDFRDCCMRVSTSLLLAVSTGFLEMNQIILGLSQNGGPPLDKTSWGNERKTGRGPSYIESRVGNKSRS